MNNNRNFNIDSRNYYYREQTINIPINRNLNRNFIDNRVDRANRELNDELNSIERSIRILNNMGYGVRADHHSLRAYLRQTRPTPQHSEGSSRFNRPTSSTSSSNHNNNTQYPNTFDRSKEIKHWANSLLHATTGWNRAFAHLKLSPLTHNDKEIYQKLICKLGITRAQISFIIDMHNLNNRPLRDAITSDVATQTDPNTSLTDDNTDETTNTSLTDENTDETTVSIKSE